MIEYVHWTESSTCIILFLKFLALKIFSQKLRSAGDIPQAWNVRRRRPRDAPQIRPLLSDGGMGPHPLHQWWYHRCLWWPSRRCRPHLPQDLPLQALRRPHCPDCQLLHPRPRRATVLLCLEASSPTPVSSLPLIVSCLVISIFISSVVHLFVPVGRWLDMVQMDGRGRGWEA